ncbi:MAG TPA: RNA polymerase sigma factor [Fimbriimonadaceae bacterium]|nr:RNA polymerase sigma factor [Fimbriimonadaceae bacterium]
MHDNSFYLKSRFARVAQLAQTSYESREGHNRTVDSRRFERLVKEHKDAVYRQMVRVCEHREDAEDALAAALMNAFLAADQLSSEDAFRGWLATIGRRVCTRMRHHHAFAETLDYAEKKGLVADHAPEFDLQIMKRCVHDAVDQLPPTLGLVYRACELEERSLAEAAEELGISEAAAKSRLHRARQAVRTALDQSVCSTVAS